MDLKKVTNFEHVLELVGSWSRYNISIFALVASVGFITAMQIMSAEFLGVSPNHWCQVDELVEANWTADQIRNFASPNNESCTYLDYDYKEAVKLGYEEAMADRSKIPGGSQNITCSKRFFEDDVQSVVTEWDLVCDKLVFQSTITASPQIGLFISSFTSGFILDGFGRRKGMIGGVLMFIPIGLLTSASVNVYMYIVLRILVVAAGFCSTLGAFILGLELCTPELRSLVSCYNSIPWSVGYMLTAVIAYFITSWRYLQVAYTLPALVPFVLQVCLMPESPRWLVQKGRYEEALMVLKRYATNNKKTIPSDEEMLKMLERIGPQGEEREEDSSFLNRLKGLIKPQLQLRTLAVFFCWLTVAMVYYGVSQGSSNLGINKYMFIFLGGILEIIGYFVVWPCINIFGRKISLSLTFIITGLSSLGVVVMMLSGYSGDHVGFVTLSFIGKFTIGAAFQIIYIFTGELYPTGMRSLMVAESSFCGRIGSISSPYVNILMGNIHKWLPSAFFGSFSMLAGILSLVLRETRGQALDVDLKPIADDATSIHRNSVNSVNKDL